MTQIPLTPEQQRFISSPPLTALQLNSGAGRPSVGVARVASETSSATSGPVCERRPAGWPSIARMYRFRPSPARLNWPRGSMRQLSQRQTAVFRSPRSFSTDLIPEQKAEYSQINDTVMGGRWQGESLAENRSRCEWVPDPHRALLALEVSGQIAP